MAGTARFPYLRIAHEPLDARNQTASQTFNPQIAILLNGRLALMHAWEQRSWMQRSHQHSLEVCRGRMPTVNSTEAYSQLVSCNAFSGCAVQGTITSHETQYWIE